MSTCHQVVPGKRGPRTRRTGGGVIDEAAARRCSTDPADGGASEDNLLPYAPDIPGNLLGERVVKGQKSAARQGLNPAGRLQAMRVRTLSVPPATLLFVWVTPVLE